VGREGGGYKKDENLLKRENIMGTKLGISEGQNDFGDGRRLVE